MLEDATQAVGSSGGNRIAERRSITLDVVSGAKQLIASCGIETAFAHGFESSREPLALRQHPVVELVGEATQRLLGTGHRIIAIVLGDAFDSGAQRIWLGDDLVVVEGVDLKLWCRRFGRHLSVHAVVVSLSTAPCRA